MTMLAEQKIKSYWYASVAAVGLLGLSAVPEYMSLGHLPWSLLLTRLIVATVVVWSWGVAKYGREEFGPQVDNYAFLLGVSVLGHAIVLIAKDGGPHSGLFHIFINLLVVSIIFRWTMKRTLFFQSLVFLAASFAIWHSGVRNSEEIVPALFGIFAAAVLYQIIGARSRKDFDELGKHHEGKDIIIKQIRKQSDYLGRSVQMQRQQMKMQEKFVAQIEHLLEDLLGDATHISITAAHVAEEAIQSLKLMQKSASEVDSIGKASRSAGETATTIRNLSANCEVLALNAALEGARAGPAGRGFSLVANRMNDLARSIQHSVEVITSLAETVDASRERFEQSAEEEQQLIYRARLAAQAIVTHVDRQKELCNSLSLRIRDLATNAKDMLNRGEQGAEQLHVALSAIRYGDRELVSQNHSSSEEESSATGQHKITA